MHTSDIDFVAESARAVVVDCRDGCEVAAVVHPCSKGSIDQCLPDSDQQLPPDWTLQDPANYLAVYQQEVPTVLQLSGIPPNEIKGLGINFTACTRLPTTRDGTPLCFCQRGATSHTPR